MKEEGTGGITWRSVHFPGAQIIRAADVHRLREWDARQRRDGRVHVYQLREGGGALPLALGLPGHLDLRTSFLVLGLFTFGVKKGSSYCAYHERDAGCGLPSTQFSNA